MESVLFDPRGVLLTLVLISAALFGRYFLVKNETLAVPEGTYLKSCNRIRFSEGYLSALCVKLDQTSQPTRVYIPRCRGVEIGNRNGQLTCGG